MSLNQHHSQQSPSWSFAIAAKGMAALSFFIAAPAYADADLTADPGDTSVKRIPADEIPPDHGGDSTTLQASASFHIFYSPNCATSHSGSASRFYPGLNSGEAWINDTFNDATAGANGYGQLIRSNAASISVTNAAVYISDDGGYSYIAFSSRGTLTCFNLADKGMRNRNTNWITRTAF